jgi:hypothetical protein
MDVTNYKSMHFWDSLTMDTIGCVGNIRKILKGHCESSTLWKTQDILLHDHLPAACWKLVGLAHPRTTACFLEKWRDLLQDPFEPSLDIFWSFHTQHVSHCMYIWVGGNVWKWMENVTQVDLKHARCGPGNISEHSFLHLFICSWTGCCEWFKDVVRLIEHNRV